VKNNASFSRGLPNVPWRHLRRILLRGSSSLALASDLPDIWDPHAFAPVSIAYTVLALPPLCTCVAA